MIVDFMTTLDIGKAIVERRKDLQLTQAELARLAACSKPTVIAAEQGKPTQRTDKLLDILRILGLTLTVTDERRP